MAELTVHGRARVEAEPDEGVLEITIGGRAATVSEAFEQLAERTATVETTLDELGVAAGARVSGGLDVGHAADWTDEGRSRDWAAQNVLEVTLPDPELLARCALEVTRAAEARVAGPVWRLHGSHPAHGEVRTHAARDARARGDALAEGLGLTLGAVLSARERRGGSYDEDDDVYEMEQHSAMSGAGPALHPRRVSVTATVEVVFAADARP